MTQLSVNLNKIALLRNSRGRDFPNVVDFAEKFIALGVQGITIHPRPDARHATAQDAYDLKAALRSHPGVELNIEGYPTEDFLALVETVKPDQCTLVPDEPGQLTSDHGWDFSQHAAFLDTVLARIHAAGVRSSVFLDPDTDQVQRAANSSAQRIELYTEGYASAYETASAKAVLANYREAADLARSLGLGVNAGHDLDLTNLPDFLTIPGILEVSIGHVLTVECIERGMDSVIKAYLSICSQNPAI
ncbi:pyridoxine 5'-phosphate synthase [Saccharospirillum impatiens]|uniref:pyridoxine 5'-phosphate synthase n=1 Tax=Saccharospirillum impatiens TaxID=169438 RepID=UPI00041830C9|nr:pyridoxine 5'-phosphate synthase [Saccharospirillum impatiens]